MRLGWASGQAQGLRYEDIHISFRKNQASSSGELSVFFLVLNGRWMLEVLFSLLFLHVGHTGVYNGLVACVAGC